MRGTKVPDTDHVVRHTKRSNILPTGRVSAVAFMLRPSMPDGKPEEYLSVNWLEHLHPADTDTQMRMVRDEFAANLRLSRSQKLLRLNVGTTTRNVAEKMEDGRHISVHHAELPTSPSHSGVYDCRPDEEMIAELIAETVIGIYDAIAAPPS